MFRCSRCDFRDKIYVEHEGSLEKGTIEKIMVDISEMIGYHAGNILPELNGFSGYDTVNFEIKIVKG